MNGFVFGVIILAVGTGVLGCLGVIAYFRIRENIRFLLDGHKIQHGRLTVAENTIRVQIDTHSDFIKGHRGTEKGQDARVTELCKSLQRVSSDLGAARKDWAKATGLTADILEKHHAQFVALAKELGYEVKTVDAGPQPVVSAIQKNTPEKRTATPVKQAS